MSRVCNKIKIDAFYCRRRGMDTGFVFSIEEFSVFDGPGIRTSVFLKGCPIRCEWCHNPEGQSFENTVLRSPNGCVGCGACEKYASSVGEKKIYTEESIKNCPQNLLRYSAVEYTPEALYERLRKNFPILNASGGGVTFSGGEPTANHTFLIRVLRLLDGKVHRAVQTSGYCPPSVFLSILRECEYMLFDIKLVDSDLHKKYTGVSNDRIIENFKALVKSKKPFVIRTPLIPGVTDTEKNIREIAVLLSENGVQYIELLPYNRMAGAKYSLIGKAYTPSFDGSVEVETHMDIFDLYNIKAKII